MDNGAVRPRLDSTLNISDPGDTQALKDMVRSLANSPNGRNVSVVASYSSVGAGPGKSRPQRPLTAENVYSDHSSDESSADREIEHQSSKKRETHEDTTMHFEEESHNFVGVARAHVEPTFNTSTFKPTGGGGGLNSSRPTSRTASSTNLLRTRSSQQLDGNAVLERMMLKDKELQLKKETLVRIALKEAEQECTFHPTIHAYPDGTQRLSGDPTYIRETEAFATRRTAALADRRRLAERRQQQLAEERRKSETLPFSQLKASSGLGDTAAKRIASEGSLLSLGASPIGPSSRPTPATFGGVHPHLRRVGGSPTDSSSAGGRTYVFGSPAGRHNSGILRSETSTTDMVNMTFQPSIGSRSRNVYSCGARVAEGSLDTFTRLYSRSLSYQLTHPDFKEKLEREQEVRVAYRRANLNETNAIAVLGEGSPRRRFVAKFLLDVLPGPLAEELDLLRARFGRIRDRDLLDETASGQHHLPPHFMVPFLRNVLNVPDNSFPFVDTQGVGLNLAPQSPQSRSTTPSRKLGGGTAAPRGLPPLMDRLCDVGAYVPPPSVPTPRRSQSSGHVRTDDSQREFLARQKSLIESKRRKTEALAKKLAPSGKPTLSKGTLSIANRQARSASAQSARDGTTPQRNLSPRQKREIELSKPRSQSSKHYDTNLTFKPVISPFASETIDGRTTDRMYEEGKRRTDRIERLKEMAWKKEQEAGTTFKPKTNSGNANSRYSNVQSLLHPTNVRNNVYAAYLDKRKQVRERLHEAQVVEAAEEDLRECTFRPAINHQPSYISRMAQNYSLLKK